jgi:hypothetical protein
MPITRVFICYKKMLAGDRPNEKAGILYFILSEDRSNFDPWIDDSGLPAGIVWETEIYRRLLTSDVLLLLIGPGTAESQWVRREIALATALGISILPLGFDLSRSEFEHQLKELDIGHIQARLTQNIKLTTRDALLAEVRPDLLGASLRTKETQKETLRELWARRNPVAPKAKDDQKAATFRIKGTRREITLHIATGDLSRIRDVDVFCNSENDYMQMARFFESRTVSSMLRRRGARVHDGKYEDTIQQELDWQLRDRGRPVQVAEVFATSSGGPTSELMRLNKVRYILHIASVQAVDSQGIVIPFREPHQIEACVRASIGKLVEINAINGVISPPGSAQRAAQEHRASSGDGACRSILFPLLGTGQGGAAASEVVGPMLAGLTGYLLDEGDSPAELAVSEVYFSAFRQQDAEQTIAALQAILGQGQ